MYVLNLWPALLRYCDNGAVEIDNSAAERALRRIAIGRRNYLFVGADSGGERAAAIYSLIGTAKLNGAVGLGVGVGVSIAVDVAVNHYVHRRPRMERALADHLLSSFVRAGINTGNA